MADRQASRYLVRPDEERVAMETYASIFNIRINLKHLLKKTNLHAKQKYDRIMDEMSGRSLKSRTPSLGPRKTQANKRKGSSSRVDTTASDALTRDGGERSCTGFAIARNGNKLRILTCAHGMDDVYKAGMHSVNVDDLNLIFQFDVLCLHQEHWVVNQPGGKPIVDRVRWAAAGKVMAVDTAKDLMVLDVDLGQVYCGWSKSGKEIVCKDDHPVLTMATSAPHILETIFLQGWPNQCYKALSCGQMSFEGRVYSALTQLNPKGYDMELSEIIGMLGSDGFSGGPVLNGKNEYLGVYHGVIDSRGYSVCLRDIKAFLNRFNMLTFHQ